MCGHSPLIHVCPLLQALPNTGDTLEEVGLVEPQVLVVTKAS